MIRFEYYHVSTSTEIKDLDSNYKLFTSRKRDKDITHLLIEVCNTTHKTLLPKQKQTFESRF